MPQNKRKMQPISPCRQKGAVTMFSAVMILILLTAVTIYATQVGVFEQRKSSNDMRQKQAFHAAEAGIQHAKEFFLGNSLMLSYPGDDGWMNADSKRWQPCPADPAPTHPCSGEELQEVAAVYNSTMFYCAAGEDCSDVGDVPGPSLLPIDTDTVLSLGDMNERVEVQALLCILDVDRSLDSSVEPVVQGCTTTPGEFEHIYFMLTLLARGQADCDDPDDPDTCKAEVLIAEKVGSFGPGSGDGGPDVPLTARSAFPPGGTAEIVPNPNGGGIGVPISAWINGRTKTCPDGSTPPDEPVDPNGSSWSTCEAHEWYGVSSMPEDFACPTAQCQCGQQERRISYTDGNDPKIGMDLLVDENFPCDLFQATFGVAGTPENFWKLAGSIGEVIDPGSCGDLDENSSGVIWVIGEGECTLNGNGVVGSAEFPVFLISTASLTTMLGTGVFWGVVYVTDVLGPGSALFKGGGGFTTYGALVVDAGIDKFIGTFTLVYNDSVVNLASNSGGIGEVTGGWTDSHRYWQ